MTKQESPTSASGSQTILVVDDDSSMLALCSTKLQAQGFTVLQASESPEALQMCTQYSGPIHLLLTDLLLPPKKLQLASEKKFPSMHGFELMRRVVAMRPETRVILMSAHSDDVLKAHGVVTEKWPFLRKPFNPEALIQRVHEVLAGPPVASEGKGDSGQKLEKKQPGKKEPEWFD
jgi:CheY-like chemotaxis protein